MMSLLTQTTWRWTVSWTFQRARMKMERCFELFLSPFMGFSVPHIHTHQTSLCFFVCVCVQMVTLYLVKWCSLPYEDSTWELKADIDQSKIEEYERIAARTPNTKRVVSSFVCACVDRTSLGAICVPASSQ